MAKNKQKLEDMITVGEKYGNFTVIEIKTSQVLVEYPENYNDGKTQGTIIKRAFVSKDEFLATYFNEEEKELDLSKLSVKELKEMAKEAGIEVKKMKKDEIIAAIKIAEAVAKDMEENNEETTK